MEARAADEGDQKRKFNQAHKLMKKANVDQFNFTFKLVETIDSAKSAAENAQQEMVKLDLAGEKLNWILLAEKSSLFGGLLRKINRRTWQPFQSAKRCSHAASGSQEEEDQFSYSAPSTADSNQWYRQLQPQTNSFNPSLSCQVLLFFLPVGWILKPVLPVKNPVIGIPVTQQWPSKHLELQIDWMKDHNQVQPVLSFFAGIKFLKQNTVMWIRNISMFSVSFDITL